MHRRTQFTWKSLNDKAEIKDAAHVWGKGIVETSEILGESLGKRTKIMCIGPGGENLVKFAIIGGDTRAFGRTGMGAVMGSKKAQSNCCFRNEKSGDSKTRRIQGTCQESQ